MYFSRVFLLFVPVNRFHLFYCNPLIKLFMAFAGLVIIVVIDISHVLKTQVSSTQKQIDTLSRIAGMVWENWNRWHKVFDFIAHCFRRSILIYDVDYCNTLEMAVNQIDLWSMQKVLNINFLWLTLDTICIASFTKAHFWESSCLLCLSTEFFDTHKLTLRDREVVSCST